MTQRMSWHTWSSNFGLLASLGADNLEVTLSFYQESS
jgi:hypothetical protein